MEFEVLIYVDDGEISNMFEKDWENIEMFEEKVENEVVYKLKFMFLLLRLYEIKINVNGEKIVIRNFVVWVKERLFEVVGELDL